MDLEQCTCGAVPEVLLDIASSNVTNSFIVTCSGCGKVSLPSKTEKLAVANWNNGITFQFKTSSALQVQQGETTGVFMPSGTEARVCALIAQRQALGINKYGTTVANNPLSHKEWLQHALEEALDQAVYLARAIEELEK
jgi:hypothetical protein